MAVCMGVDEFAMLDNRYGGGGDAGLVEDLRGDAVDASFEGGVDGVDGLRGEGERSGCNEKEKGDARRDLGHCRNETPVNRDGKRLRGAMRRRIESWWALPEALRSHFGGGSAIGLSLDDVMEMGATGRWNG